MQTSASPSYRAKGWELGLEHPASLPLPSFLEEPTALERLPLPGECSLPSPSSGLVSLWNLRILTEESTFLKAEIRFKNQPFTAVTCQWSTQCAVLAVIIQIPV